MYPVMLMLPARGYRVLGGYTGPLRVGGVQVGEGYTLPLPGFCLDATPRTVTTIPSRASAKKVRSAHRSSLLERATAE